MSASTASPLLGPPPPKRSTSKHDRFAFATRPHLQDEAFQSGGGGGGGGVGFSAPQGTTTTASALSPAPAPQSSSNLHDLGSEQNPADHGGTIRSTDPGGGGGGGGGADDRNSRQSHRFWEPKIDVQGGARFFDLAPSELARSKAKLVLARLCFFLVAMTLYTFSDALDNIALTILRESNASETEVRALSVPSLHVDYSRTLYSKTMYDVLGTRTVHLRYLPVLVLCFGAARRVMSPSSFALACFLTTTSNNDDDNNNTSD